MTALVTCPHCALVAKLLEDDCPHCGKALRGSEGRIALTAAAALLGLTMSACGAEPAPAYGVAPPNPNLVEPPPPPNPDPGAVPTVTPTTTPSATPPTTPSATPSSSTSKPIQPPAAAYGVPPVSDPLTPPKPRP